ncbi:MAG: filamentous hemagglutinin N-terminal domain-containing protein [Cyanobacteria bacterium P01_H01_bin.21]
MNHKQSYFLIITSFMAGLGAISPHTYAQISPDGSLSTSVTSPDGQNFVIENGDRTGNNLFHSFSEFSIPTNGSAVFNNPTDIETIFSRVTGPSLSDIDGLLQTMGTTNLFLLNPNGIIFGPNVQLDVAGSFTASTTNSLIFADGTEFSATAPEPSLLSISVPVGPQLNTQGDIESRGQLETGQNLTLLGQNLYLEGDLIAGQDLILQAQDTVTMRDTLARSGNILTIQGGQGIDILALNCLVPFVSGGNLTLISDGDISADAHFESGGNLQFLTLTGMPGNVVSFYNPIIFADGDVVLGDYTGVALKVEATGSIEAGDIVITGPDTTLTADGSGSDEDLLASSRAAILRAGIESVNGQPAGSIAVRSIRTSDNTGGNGGPIVLEAKGNITVFGSPVEFGFPTVLRSSSSGSDSGTTGDGGAISITSRSGDITILGSLNTSSSSRPSLFPDSGIPTLGSGDGGEITLTTDTGNIFIGGRLDSGAAALAIDTFLPSFADNSGNGGAITLTSNSGDIAVEGDVESSSIVFAFSIFDTAFAGTSSDGGAINITSDSGNIVLDGRLDSSGRSAARSVSSSFSSTSSGNSGNGGPVTIVSRSGDIVTNNTLVTASISQSGSTEGIASTGNSGSGGDIAIFSDSGDITINTSPFEQRTIYIASSSVSSAESGDPLSETATGSFAFAGSSSNGGDITLSSDSGDIVVDVPILDSSSASDAAAEFGVSGNAQNGGAISISSATGDIQTNTDLRSFSLSTTGTAGQAGDISLLVDTGSISGNQNLLLAFSVARTGEATGGGGDISLGAGTAISGLEAFTLASNGPSGNVTIQGLSDSLIINDLRLTTTAQFSIPSLPILAFGQDDATIDLDFGDFGESGETFIGGMGDITLNNVIIQADANGTQPAGDVTIDSPGQVTLISSQINSNANSQGQAGNVEITADRLLLKDNSRINATTLSSDGGNVTLTLEDLLLLREGSAISTTAGTARTGGNGGNITISLTDGVVAAIPAENSDITANAFEGDGGNIQITADGIVGLQFRPELTPLSDITASSEFGVNGVVQLDTPNVEPSQGLVELPAELIDPSNQISTSCLVAVEENSLTVSGRSGLPDSPDTPNSSTVWEDWRPLETEASLATTSTSVESTPLVEATEVVVATNGQVEFVAESETLMSSNLVSCGGLRL